MLHEWSLKGYPSECDLFIARAVLQYNEHIEIMFHFIQYSDFEQFIDTHTLSLLIVIGLKGICVYRI
jgi:hypothetical protein